MKNINEYLNINDFSKKYGVPVPTVRDWINKKRIRAIRNINPFIPHQLWIHKKEWNKVLPFIGDRYK